MRNNRKSFVFAAIAVLAMALGSIQFIETAKATPIQGAYFNVNSTVSTGYVWSVTSFIGGLPVFSQSTLAIPTTGTVSPVLRGTLTTTAATSDALTLTGLSTAGVCTFSATNSTAATNIATSYISAVAANSVTLTHVATASMTYNFVCTPS
jgi:hypothetical protein